MKDMCSLMVWNQFTHHGSGNFDVLLTNENMNQYNNLQWLTIQSYSVAFCPLFPNGLHYYT